jgi:hypothetical protein
VWLSMLYSLFFADRIVEKAAKQTKKPDAETEA